jgi:hypothetical protein
MKLQLDTHVFLSLEPSEIGDTTWRQLTTHEAFLFFDRRLNDLRLPGEQVVVGQPASLPGALENIGFDEKRLESPRLRFSSRVGHRGACSDIVLPDVTKLGQRVGVIAAMSLRRRRRTNREACHGG